jgi:hypothetical protein
MSDAEDDKRPAGSRTDLQRIQCSMCKAALESPGRETVSFLLLDQFTIPLVGCPEHLQQFRKVCGLTTEGSATLLQHRPAGGVPCPSCHHSTHRPHHPVVPVKDGAVAVLSCSEHADDIVGRFQAGLETHQRLTTTIQSDHGT